MARRPGSPSSKGHGLPSQAGTSRRRAIRRLTCSSPRGTRLRRRGREIGRLGPADHADYQRGEIRRRIGHLGGICCARDEHRHSRPVHGGRPAGPQFQEAIFRARACARGAVTSGRPSGTPTSPRSVTCPTVSNFASPLSTIALAYAGVRMCTAQQRNSRLGGVSALREPLLNRARLAPIVARSDLGKLIEQVDGLLRHGRRRASPCSWSRFCLPRHSSGPVRNRRYSPSPAGYVRIRRLP